MEASLLAAAKSIYLHVLRMQYFTNNFPPTKFTSRTSVRDILTIPSVVLIKGTNPIDLRVYKNQPINAGGSDPDPVA